MQFFACARAAAAATAAAGITACSGGDGHTCARVFTLKVCLRLTACLTHPFTVQVAADVIEAAAAPLVATPVCRQWGVTCTHAGLALFAWAYSLVQVLIISDCSAVKCAADVGLHCTHDGWLSMSQTAAGKSDKVLCMCNGWGASFAWST